LGTDGFAAMLLGGRRATRGTLLTASRLDSLLPTLPDPYAATVPAAAIARKRIATA
jgi:hypothetical protein